MAEGPPVPPGGEANHGASTTPAEHPGPMDNQLLDTEGIAADLEKAGLYTLANNMRQPTESHEAIAQRHSKEVDSWAARMAAERKAKEPILPPLQPTDENKTQLVDLNKVADLAEQQNNHTLAAELRKLANKPPTT